MANPIKMRQHANGMYNDGVQIMSDSDMDYTAKLILTKFATEANTYVGDIFVGGTGTAIGTFTDQYSSEDLGGHVSPSISSTSYVFNQNTATAAESLTIPLTSNGSVLSPSTDTDLNNGIIDKCLDRIATASPTSAETGTYWLGNTAPTISGTWVSKHTITEKTTTNAAYDINYVLYRKTSPTITPSYNARPMKAYTTAGSIIEMSDAEIESLVTRLRNRIIATGVGTYKLQTTAPSTGTWVARGSIVDRVPTIASQNYTGSYSAQYSGQYTGSFERQYSAEYGRQFARATDGPQYGRVYSAGYERQYTGQYARATAGPQYGRTVPGPDYNRSVAGPQYTRATAGPQYGRVYSAGYERQYTGQYARATAGPQYGRVYYGQYTGVYQRYRPGWGYIVNYGTGYALVYSGSYGRTYSALYGRTYSGQYERQYSAPYGRQYSSQYGGSRPGPQYYRGSWYVRGYYTYPPGSPIIYAFDIYSRGDYNRGLPYARSYAGTSYTRFTPGPQYNRTTTGEQYGRTTAGAQYERQTAGPQYGRQRVTPYYFRYFGRVSYARVYAGSQYEGQYGRSRPGPQYTRIYSAQYGRTVVGPQYNRATAGPQYGRVYSAQYNATYVGVYSRTVPGLDYGRTYSDQYGRTVVGPQYNRETAGPQYGRIYSAQYNVDYARATPGPQYSTQFTGQYAGARDRTYAGNTVTSTYSYVTLTLWLRVA